MEQTIEQKVIAVVAQVLKKEVDAIDIQQSLAELGADDLDMFELILKIEDTFMLEISDEDALQFTRVAHIVSFITLRTTKA